MEKKSAMALGMVGVLGFGLSELLQARAQAPAGTPGRYTITSSCVGSGSASAQCLMYVLDTATGQTWTRRDINTATWEKDRPLP